MSGTGLASILGLVALIDFLLLLTVFSLREFSRSRLDEICLEKGRGDRFGDILRWDEDVLLIGEGLAALFTALRVGLLIYTFGFAAWPAGDFWAWLGYFGAGDRRRSWE